MKGNNNKMSFGFGSAMFAMKDMQDLYSNIDGKPDQLKINDTPNIKKKLQVKQSVVVKKKEEQKPKILLKNTSSVIQKPLPYKQQKQKALIKPVVIQKQLISKQCLLNTLQVSPNIFQLTANSQPTKWIGPIFKQIGSMPSFTLLQCPQISFNISAYNIKQGSLGNCYFICSLAALTQNINVVKSRIYAFQKYIPTSKGWIVSLFQSGKFVNIQVNNLFCQQFSKPIGNDISCLILQKAYAQLYGNYQIINMGHSIDSLRDLSGNLAQYIDLKHAKFNDKIIQAFANSQPMVIASKQNPLADCISAKHSYNVLGYSLKDGKLYLQLRDPRGWTKADFKKHTSLQNLVENGQFWIAADSLKDHFQVITVSKYIPNSFYYYKTFSLLELEDNGVGAIYFQLQESTKVGLSAHQKHKKFLDQKYQYKVICLMVCEVDQKGQPTRCISSTFNSQQVCCLSLQLPKGKYGLTSQLYPFHKQKQQFQQQKLTLSINSSHPISHPKTINPFNLTNALTLYILQNKSEFKQLITKENLERYHGSLFGRMCILYRNFSNKEVVEELQFQTENITINQKRIVLKRNQNKLVTYPIGPNNNCSHKCVFKSKTYYSTK